MGEDRDRRRAGVGILGDPAQLAGDEIGIVEIEAVAPFEPVVAARSVVVE